MSHTMNAAPPKVEYRFNTEPADYECPLCGDTFRTARGSWPFLAGTQTAVCGGSDCPMEDAQHASPCDTMFAFCAMDDATLDAIRRTDEQASVAERLRAAALDDSLPMEDRDLLNRASIDLAFWEADMTRIASLDNGLVLQTCPEAAAEMLLSGCGDIL
jgi:hypothetical protein